MTPRQIELVQSTWQQVLPVADDAARLFFVRLLALDPSLRTHDTVAQALIWTLQKGLGASFTPEVKQAWVAAYGVLSSTMKDAAKVPA
jgi:hypothetical protein